jgi:osmotically-inducible protein OsmY
VKARLARVGAHTLPRIHGDTYEGIVYLTVGTPSAGMKERAEALVRPARH